MKIKENNKTKNEMLVDKDIKNVQMKILIGPKDGSKNITMRHFTILPEGHTPFHQHNYEHIIKIESGKGMVVDKDGNETEVNEGQSIFIEPNEKHQFKNPFKQNFEFICIIPNQNNN